MKFGRYQKKQYLCTVFFMVLDLRLSKRLGCRDDNPSFFIIPYLQPMYFGTKKKSLQENLRGSLITIPAIYPLEIAPLGQTSAHVPHSVHKSASIV